MSRVSFVRLFSILALAFWASALSASTIAYAVGTCRPGLRSFSTISAALGAVPSANVINVCPGTYNEQVQIAHPVTVEGVIPVKNSQRATIAPPADGLVTNARDDLGNPLAVQVWVNNASGPVKIHNLTVDASFNKVTTRGTFVVGIFYQDSSGTVNRVATRNQSGNGLGRGILAEGGPSNPLVTIENSSVHDYDFAGIEGETNSATPELTAVIRDNEVTTSKSGVLGIYIFNGSAVTVTNNLIVNPGFTGIGAFGFSSHGSISVNTVTNASPIPATGIFAQADGVSVTSNNIFGTAEGIFVNTSIAAIQSNSIADSRIGIEFSCTFNPNVHSNVITDAQRALNGVPSGLASSNTYFNVDTIRAGGC
jgi:hypothetical protein